MKQYRSIIITITILTLSRLVVNMSRRFSYPFLPAISRQLSVPLASVQNVVALQAGIGVSSPLFGPLAERYGRKRVMLGTLLLMAAAGLLGALLPQFWVFALVIVAFGAVKMIFDPAVLAYVGDRISYRRRGTAVGILELSWAGSLLIAAPVVGLVFSLAQQTPPAGLFLTQMVGLETIPALFTGSSGIQMVFFGLATLALLALALIWLLVPGDYPAGEAAHGAITPWGSWQVLKNHPAALAALYYSAGVSVANEIFFINYGAWMEASFGLVLAALGAATTVIALAEVIGEVTIISLADRLGKRRLALIGAAVSSLSYIVLPALSFSLGAALFGIFLMFLFVEISIVGAIPLFTEVLPDNRAVMMSGMVGAASLGRLLGAVLGGLLFALTDNFFVIGSVSLLIGASSFVAMLHYIRES